MSLSWGLASSTHARDAAGTERSWQKPAAALPHSLGSLLDDGDGHLVGLGRRSQVRAHIVSRHCDPSAEPVGGGEGLDHDCRERSPCSTVTGLEDGHRPGEFS